MSDYVTRDEPSTDMPTDFKRAHDHLSRTIDAFVARVDRNEAKRAGR
ncbi:MAG: hypothetical protein ABI397_01260 [Candidatus Saccharimonas sp.]